MDEERGLFRMPTNDAYEALSTFSQTTLDSSNFFQNLARGKVSHRTLRQIMIQYFWWRNSFHQWFGVCIQKAPSFGRNPSVGHALEALASHIVEEVREDHYGLCQNFILQLGDDTLLPPWEVTEDYIASFPCRYGADQPFESALAALAGREIIAVSRNHRIRSALNAMRLPGDHPFWVIHETLEQEHFYHLWSVLPPHPDTLLEIAQEEIRLHVYFWENIWSVSRTLEN